MVKPVAIIGQIVLYGAFAAFIGYFSTNPIYRQIPDDVALVKLSMSHLGSRECRKRSAEELAKLPPNMRAPLDCPRGRSDTRIVLELDDKPLYEVIMKQIDLTAKEFALLELLLRRQGEMLPRQANHRL